MCLFLGILFFLMYVVTILMLLFLIHHFNFHCTTSSMNTQDWFPLEWTGWISLQSRGLSRVFSNTTGQKHQFFGAQPSLWSNSHIHNDYWKNHSFDYADLCWQSKVRDSKLSLIEKTKIYKVIKKCAQSSCFSYRYFNYSLHWFLNSVLIL